MFRWWLRMAGLICLLWLCLYAGMVAIGIQQAAPGSGDLAQYGFDKCALPCWAGIMPGETTSGFIIPSLEKYVPTYMNARFPEWGVVAFQLQHGVDGNVRFGSTVNQIYIVNLDIPTTYLIQQLGQPDCVNADERSMLMMWNRDDDVVVSIFPGSPVDFLASGTTSSGLMIFEIGADFCDRYVRWNGFAPAWYYRRETEKRR